MEWQVETDSSASSACVSSAELALEIFIIFASGLEEEELNLSSTGAGGKGNIVLEILQVGGETGRESNDLDDEFSDTVTLLPLVILVTFLG